MFRAYVVFCFLVFGCQYQPVVCLEIVISEISCCVSECDCNRVTTDLENLEKLGNSKVVREKSGKIEKVREKSG